MSPRKSEIWRKLAENRKSIERMRLRQLFDEDPKRFDLLSFEFGDLLIDFSRNRLTGETLQLLEMLAGENDVEGLRDRMFDGFRINFTEDRPVLHTALRNWSGNPVMVDGCNVMPDIMEVLSRMREFADGIRNCRIASKNGERITDVVNIGIGGSDLGPCMATSALSPYHDGPKLHFVSNVDGAHISDALAELTPSSTLFIIASKTFATIETMTNASTARRWISEALGEDSVPHHFAAISTALDRVEEFGIRADRTFGFWDWVGGRYSIWSAIGLPLMIAIGPDDFESLLKGGHEMDIHFREAPVLENLPMLMGLVGIWHRSIWQHETRAVVPYDQRLSRFPAYLQQLDMESNGKSVTRDGTESVTGTGPVVWGEPGTNGQHAFFQLIHQGASVVPVEFLIAVESHEPDMAEHHNLLIANCLAQGEALMCGISEMEAKEELVSAGMSREQAGKLAPHRKFSGDRPSTTIVYDKLDPRTLGRLIALYEHRVFVEGAVWNINSFDQWGVELGKKIARNLLPMVEGTVEPAAANSSLEGLLRRFSKRRGKVN